MAKIILNLGSGENPLEGCVNLDKENGWLAEEGLDYKDKSVDAITISHLMMYIEESDWEDFFKECWRVLKEGGVIRVTEDNTIDESSRTFKTGNPNDKELKTLTSPRIVRQYMRKAGFEVFDTSPRNSNFGDNIIQGFHGKPPHVFHIEGIKRTNCIIVAHDFSEELPDKDYYKLYELKSKNPNLKINLLTIPSKTSHSFARKWAKRDWVKLYPHGRKHTVNECKNWTRDMADRYLEEMSEIDYFGKGFCAPQYKMSPALKKAAKDRGWWVYVDKPTEEALEYSHKGYRRRISLHFGDRGSKEDILNFEPNFPPHMDYKFVSEIIKS